MKKLKNKLSKLRIIKNKVDNKCRILFSKIIIAMATISCTMANASSVNAAGSNTSSIDGFITFVTDWVFKIGGVVALIGGIMFAVGFQRDDSEGKTRGLFTLMAGFMLMAIAKSPDIFGL